jgi:allantoinase
VVAARESGDDANILIVRGARVHLPGGPAAASVRVERGVIAKVDAYDAPAPPGAEVVDAGDLAVLPGIVDTHVHVNDPGRADWEGWDTATRAAAAGGVTTLMDMPLNSIPPTTSVAALLAKAQAAEGRTWVDIGLCGGLVPGNAGGLRALFAEGALAFKCFLTESGVEEFAHVGEEDLRAGMRTLADVGAPLLVHAELSGPIDDVLSGRKTLFPDDARRYLTYLESRPRAAENEAVDLVARLSRDTRARTHVVHLSSADALLVLRDARDDGVPLSAETCPHYLSIAAEDVPDGRTEYKCAPPIRERENQRRLWDALASGLVAQVVTDHSPSEPSLKCIGTGDFLRAWGGIASLQLGLRVTWTEARARGVRLEQVVEWMCAAPARLVGLSARKGAIAEGRDGDFVLFDPDAEERVDAQALHHRHKLTPYAGRTLLGRVRATYLRGEAVYRDGSFAAAAPRGRWLRGGR